MGGGGWGDEVRWGWGGGEVGGGMRWGMGGGGWVGGGWKEIAILGSVRECGGEWSRRKLLDL